MKKDTTTNTYIELLSFIESRKVVTLEEIRKFSGIDDEDELDSYISELSGKDNNRYIKILPDHKRKSPKKDDHPYEITLDGIQFLNEYNVSKLQKSQTKYNRIIALTGTVIVLITLLNFLLNPDNTLKLITGGNGKISIFGVFVVIFLIAILAGMGGLIYELFWSKD